MFDRLGELALLNEHIAPVGVDFGGVRLDLQGALVMFDRLGELALANERIGPVDVGVSEVGPDLQGLPVVVARLSRLALLSEQNTDVVLGEIRFGVPRKNTGPKFLRVVPDLDLVPGENSQPDDDTYGNACNRRSCQYPCLRP